MKLLAIGLFAFCFFIWLVAAYGTGSKTKRTKQSKELANMVKIEENGTKISEYKKYFDKDKSTYKGWK